MRLPAKFDLLIILGAILVIVITLLWPSERPRADAPVLERRAVSPKSTSSALTRSEEDKLLPRDLGTPRFQELYDQLSQRGSSEIAALAKQLRNLPDNSTTEAKIDAFFRVWAALDPNAAFAVGREFPKRSRNGALRAVVEGADPGAAGSLVQALQNSPNDSLAASDRSRLLARAVGKWSQVDPAAAAQFVDSHGEHSLDFSMAWNQLAQNWAATDPMTALAWAQEKAKSGDRFVLSGAILGWWKNHPQAAETYVKSHLATLQDRQIAGTLAANMFVEDPERAKIWVQQLDDEEARRQACSMLAITWGCSDPAAATQWSATLPGAERRLALAETLGLWAQNDPVPARQWLATYEGPGRDEAVRNLTTLAAGKDPAVALNWASAISDPKTRAATEKQLAPVWLKQDSRAATEWTRKSDLSPEERSVLLVNPPDK